MSMAGYTKLFNSILASTIWRADDQTRIVWITLLAMADKHGIAEGSVPGLADFARVSLADCERALEFLQAPDTYSRSKVRDGRRIEAVDGGWRLINHDMYRATMNADERREYLRVKQAETRARRKAKLDDVNAQSTNIDKRIQPSTEVNAVNTSIEHRASAESREQRAEKNVQALSADADFEAFKSAYPASRRMGGAAAKRAFREARKACDIDIMLVALEQHKRSEQWQTPKLILGMAAWLNQQRWLQVLPEVGAATGNPKTAGNLAALKRFAERRTL